MIDGDCQKYLNVVDKYLQVFLWGHLYAHLLNAKMDAAYSYALLIMNLLAVIIKVTVISISKPPAIVHIRPLVSP